MVMDVRYVRAPLLTVARHPAATIFEDRYLIYFRRGAWYLRPWRVTFAIPGTT